jgi:polyisoprenoid-binding protein YceI
MKQLLAIFLVLYSIFFSSFAVAVPETFKIDPEHSYVLWQIKHFGFSTQSGKWVANGTVVLDKEHPQNSKVDVSIQLGDIITGNNNLDKHLKGKLFFDVEHFPIATFKSEKVEVTGQNKAIVYGILTLHGISKPVDLNVVLNKVGLSPITDKMTVGFTANTDIKRSQFGINTLLPGLSDDVKLNIEAEAYQEGKQASS